MGEVVIVGEVVEEIKVLMSNCIWDPDEPPVSPEILGKSFSAPTLLQESTS
jgi:hypothetical protein